MLFMQDCCIHDSNLKKKILEQCFENTFLFQTKHSRASMKDKLFDQLDENKKFDELTYENLKYVVETIKNEVD